MHDIYIYIFSSLFSASHYLSTASYHAVIINENYHTVSTLKTKSTCDKSNTAYYQTKIDPQQATTTKMPRETTPKRPHKRRRLSSTPHSATIGNMPGTPAPTRQPPVPPSDTTLLATTTTRAEVDAIWSTPLVDSVRRRLIAQPTNYRPYLPTVPSPYSKPAPPHTSTVDGVEIMQYNLALRRFELHDYAWRRQKFRELGRLLLNRLQLVWAEFAREMLLEEIRASRERRRHEMRDRLFWEWLGGRPRG